MLFIYSSIYLFTYFTKVSQKFGNILVHTSLLDIYLIIEAVQVDVASSILVVGALTGYALLHSVYDLKVVWTNWQVV